MEKTLLKIGGEIALLLAAMTEKDLTTENKRSISLDISIFLCILCAWCG